MFARRRVCQVLSNSYSAAMQQVQAAVKEVERRAVPSNLALMLHAASVCCRFCVVSAKRRHRARCNQERPRLFGIETSRSRELGLSLKGHTQRKARTCAIRLRTESAA
eukprot:5560276-Pleurochrysis_carterae.AAC.1